jgi:large subunit ribosomal protein L17
MRHGLAHKKLNRNPTTRKALLRGLADQLVVNGRIETTLVKAKELRKVVEPLVSIAKVDTVANRRRAASVLYTKDAVKELFSKHGTAYASRNGGYTRILKFAFRPGDHARRALIEFV